MALLTWIGKDAVAGHDKEVPFKLLKKIKSASVGSNAQNLIIHGDNLEALKAIVPFYYNKVKCIYIDPPYNTGNQVWKYNDRVNSPKIKQWLGKVVGRETEDLLRHDKWLCMMYPRLKLLKDLLSNDGAIFISIDDNEIHNLRLIMDEIFGSNNFVVNIVWEKVHTRKNSAKYFSYNHDYILCFAKDKSAWKRNFLPREGTTAYKNPDNDPKGPWKLDPIYANNPYALNYKITKPDGTVISRPEGRYWRFSEKTIQQKIKDREVIWGKGNSYPLVKRYLSEVQEGLVPITIFTREFAGDNALASAELSELFGQEKTFEYSKPTKLIKRILQIATNPNDIVLDSFAGSGTTGHAVLDLNKEDGGKRKFILVELEDDVAKDITAKRVELSIKKHNYSDGFEYCELDKALFDKNGQIENECSFEQLASYIYFTETQTNIDKFKLKKNYIGEYENTEYYLIYKDKNKNYIKKDFLKRIKKDGKRKIVYADKCLIDYELLSEYKVTFKQIPYEVKVY